MHFPELLFVVVDPGSLSVEGKKQVADWLCKSQGQQCTVVVVLTTPWHLPSSAEVQALSFQPDREIQYRWREQLDAHLYLYQGAAPPLGAGPSSGKSNCVRKDCGDDAEVLPCIVHEGFKVGDFVAAAAKHIKRCMESGKEIALHIDLTAYSCFNLTNTFLRHLLLCKVIYDPLTGQMVHLPYGVRIYFEIGALVDRDVHTLKVYSTKEVLKSKFPAVHESELSLLLLYPILHLVA